jgi:ribonuclease BN (tRNA processing enzyme)
MDFTVLGGSAAWPNPGQAASGYLLETAQRRILIDCGSGIAGVLRAEDPGPLTDIFISHFHADHWFDLVPLHFLYLYGIWNTRPRPSLYLPPDGRTMVDRVASVWNGSIETFDRAFDVSEYDPSSPIELDGLRFTFAPTTHYCTCYAMRIEGPKATIGFTADTAPDDRVCELMHDADLLVSEASLATASSDNEGQRGHMAPGEAATLATRARASRLLLTHVPVEHDLGTVLSRAQRVFSGPVEVARPGLRYRLAET